MSGRHSIRIPIHGFVEVDDWEWDIVNHPVFQRLRRIRQLAFSEHVYPGSTHSRFEHSLGVLHIATRLFDTLKSKHKAILEVEFGFNEDSFARSRRLVRLAALLHDVGHAPFSHSSELLMPVLDDTRLQHEDYSAALIAEEMQDVIDNHPANQSGLRITGREVADFYQGKSTIGQKLLLWRELVNGQLDADRMDYLLRDSHHCGVSYGMFDLDRIVDTITFVDDESEENSAGGLRVGIEEGGQHAADGLLLARRFMFTQVYFHKTRLAFDHHASESVRLHLGDGAVLPNPRTKRGRKRFIKLDDWAVAASIRSGKANRHGRAILQHTHDRCIRKTKEVAKPSELRSHDEALQRICDAEIDAWEADASNSWYKAGRTEIRIGIERQGSSIRKAVPLAECSEVVGKIRDSRMKMIFVPVEDRGQAEELLGEGDHDELTRTD